VLLLPRLLPGVCLPRLLLAAASAARLVLLPRVQRLLPGERAVPVLRAAAVLRISSFAAGILRSSAADVWRAARLRPPARVENSGSEPDLVFAYAKTRSGSDPEFVRI